MQYHVKTSIGVVLSGDESTHQLRTEKIRSYLINTSVDITWDRGMNDILPLVQVERRC